MTSKNLDSINKELVKKSMNNFSKAFEGLKMIYDPHIVTLEDLKIPEKKEEKK